MQVQHVVPAQQARSHERTLDCPCRPSQSVTKLPGEQPAVVITHHPFKTPRSTAT